MPWCHYYSYPKFQYMATSHSGLHAMNYLYAVSPRPAGLGRVEDAFLSGTPNTRFISTKYYPHNISKSLHVSPRLPLSLPPFVTQTHQLTIITYLQYDTVCLLNFPSLLRRSTSQVDGS